MYDLGMVAISGGRSRSSFFSDRMGDVFGPSLGRAQLGQTGFGNYQQTKNDVAVWDSLVARLQRVNSQAARDSIAGTYGINNPTDNTKGQYMRNRSANDVAIAEQSNPPDTSKFDSSAPGPTKNDAKDLEGFLGGFQSAVQAAENQYGTVLTPQVITNYVSTPTTPDWVLPVVAGGAAVGVLALLGVFKGIF